MNISPRKRAPSAKGSAPGYLLLTVLVAAILLGPILIQGCSPGVVRLGPDAQAPGSGGVRVGSGTAVSLNQLWGMVAQHEGAYADGAILAELEMTLSATQEGSLPPEQTARMEELHLVAWAHGPTIKVAATWPERGPGELSTETHEPRNDPMPPPVGYPLAELFPRLDYLGISALFDGLRPFAVGQTVGLRLVYPPPQSPSGAKWKWSVPVLVVHGHSLQKAVEADIQAWTDLGVFQIVSAPGDEVRAILLVAEE